MDFRLVVKKDMKYQICPSCRNHSTLKRRRSGNIFGKVLKLLKLSTYYCTYCGWSGKIYTYKLSRKFFWTLLIYVGLTLATMYLIWFLINLYIEGLTTGINLYISFFLR